LNKNSIFVSLKQKTMSASANILNILNTRIGTQHIDYLSGLKKIFVQTAAALTALGRAEGATVLAQTNALSNQEFAYGDEIKAIWTNIGNALNALGQTTYGGQLITYTRTSPVSNVLWGDQTSALILAIQQGLAALGQ
jgi:hypothetical protein